MHQGPATDTLFPVYLQPLPNRSKQHVTAAPLPANGFLAIQNSHNDCTGLARRDVVHLHLGKNTAGEPPCDCESQRVRFHEGAALAGEGLEHHAFEDVPRTPTTTALAARVGGIGVVV